MRQMHLKLFQKKQFKSKGLKHGDLTGNKNPNKTNSKLKN